ncbi:hypothetical protein M378DRAFT_172617 [Amanita muscaria Koide BX008]|uniref:Uncharacterized protein n=1 Tax=Amanita muscaria (strain Koide BX008) TaxID=946122 RepID=A0A0C2WK57_AMAMK|nr:hypothetical protein M378DRAFT_172617 [Amanita muscaria Koide BX008]
MPTIFEEVVTGYRYHGEDTKDETQNHSLECRASYSREMVQTELVVAVSMSQFG